MSPIHDEEQHPGRQVSGTRVKITPNSALDELWDLAELYGALAAALTLALKISEKCARVRGLLPIADLCRVRDDSRSESDRLYTQIQVLLEKL